MSSIPGQSGFMRTILLLACVLPHICSVTSESDKETCYSQQHRGVTVNIRLAVTKGTIMIPRETPSEKDCILTCCSEDVNPGVKCNRVVYKPPEGSSSENCYLFYCPNEQDCPLMTAKTGVNTYNIFKGVTHPTTKVNGKAAAKPATNLNPHLNTTMPTTIPPTTTSTTITTTTVTTLVTTTTKPTITKLPITIRPTTTTTDIPSTEALKTPTEGPTELHQTTSMTSATIATTTTTTQSTTTTTTTTQPTTITQTTSTTTKARPPARPAAKPSRPRKPSKPLRGPETHSVKPTKAKTATPHPITSTAPSTTAPTTTTTTTTAAPQTSTGTTVALVEFDSKERAVNKHPLLPPVLGSAPVKPRFSRTMWKNSLVAVVVITLIFLLLILALVARKAMESFDRRHYTRLELNDLHYEV